jgi:membrane protease YdiL (CAAX protease family)
MMSKIFKWIVEAVVNTFALRTPKSSDLAFSALSVIVIGFLATQLINLLIRAFPRNTPEGLDTINKILSDPSGALFVSVIVAVCIIAPIVEEIIFRGILWRVSEKLISSNFAWAATSILFALAHLDLIHIIAVFPLGVLFGYLRKRTNSIVAPMLAHALHNTISILTVIF